MLVPEQARMRNTAARQSDTLGLTHLLPAPNFSTLPLLLRLLPAAVAAVGLTAARCGERVSL